MVLFYMGMKMFYLKIELFGFHEILYKLIFK